MESLKNPLLLGVLAGLLLYGYYWYMKNKNITEMKYKYSMYVSQGVMSQEQATQMSNSLESEDVSFVKPVLLGVLVWIIANWYFTRRSVDSYMNDASGMVDDASEFVVSIVPLC
jgi:hypothetical protein